MREMSSGLGGLSVGLESAGKKANADSSPAEKQRVRNEKCEVGAKAEWLRWAPGLSKRFGEYQLSQLGRKPY